MAIIYGTDHSEVDYNTPTGQVRLLISDVSTDLAVRLFNEAQLETFLSLHGGSIYRAAARALRTVATSELLTSKVLRLQNGTTTDGAKVSAELRALADTYDADADKVDASADGGYFEVIPFYDGGFEAAERYLP